MDLLVIFLEKEMVCQVIENHRVAAVDGVGFTELLNPRPDAVPSLFIELKDSQPHQGPHTVLVQLERSLEGEPGLVCVPELQEAVTHPQSH